MLRLKIYNHILSSNEGMQIITVLKSSNILYALIPEGELQIKLFICSTEVLKDNTETKKIFIKHYAEHYFMNSYPEDLGVEMCEGEKLYFIQAVERRGDVYLIFEVIEKNKILETHNSLQRKFFNFNNVI